MKVSQFKTYTDALARFATTREKALGPESLIGVQKRGDTLKLISGHSRAGMSVTIPEHESEDGNYAFTVNARPLLQSVKVLPASTEVVLKAGPDGLRLQAAGGGIIDLGKSDVPLREAGFAKKPKGFVAEGTIDVKNLKRMSKLFKAICAKVTVASIQTHEGVGYAVAIAPGNGSQYANYRFPAGGSDNYNMSGYREFWEALTHFSEDGKISWGKGGILVTSGQAECFSSPYLVSRWDEKTHTAEPPSETIAPPIMVATDKSDIMIKIDRKNLIAIVKGQAPFDEHNRVTLTVDTDSLRVSPYGSNDGQGVPATTEGKGIRSVNADYLNGLLNAMDAKEVTLRWSGGVPAISISAEDYENWTILLAPVAL